MELERMMGNVSPNVVIMTYAELDEIKQKSFKDGFRRGEFEASKSKDERVARNCPNWKNGVCHSCGVQWQDGMVSGDYKCRHFGGK